MKCLVFLFALSASVFFLGCKTSTTTTANADGSTVTQHTSEVWVPTAEQAAVIQGLVTAGVHDAGQVLALYQQYFASTNSAAASADSGECTGGDCSVKGSVISGGAFRLAQVRYICGVIRSSSR